MPVICADGIVTRYANYRESDRILSIFTIERGRIDVKARGCRKPQSPLVNVCQPFVFGQFEIFTGKEVTLQAVMASACLPQIFQAVEIHGKAYWDGGYVANPPLTPLISLCDTPDILLVQINPLVREGVPTTQSGISDRINEIGFNSNLLSQMQVIGLINRLIEEGKLHEPDFKQVRMHRIDGGDMLKDMSAASRVSTDAGMIEQLFEHGRHQAKRWLSRNFAAVGERSSVNLRKDYADDMVINA